MNEIEIQLNNLGIFKSRNFALNSTFIKHYKRFTLELFAYDSKKKLGFFDVSIASLVMEDYIVMEGDVDLKWIKDFDSLFNRQQYDA